MTDTFDAGKLSKYLSGESDAAAIVQYHNETSKVKNGILSILTSEKKDSLILELYDLRDQLHELLEKYANIDATEQLALVEKEGFENLDLGIGIAYESARLSHTLSLNVLKAQADVVKGVEKYIKDITKAHENKKAS